MTYLLLACPKCHAGYKIGKESAQAQVTCRACGHKWVPAQAAPAAGRAKAAPAKVPVGQGLVPADKLGALASMATEHDSHIIPATEAIAQGPPAKPAAGEALDAIARSMNRRPSGATPADGSRTSGGLVAATPSRVAPGLREDKTDPLVGTAINGFKIQSRIGSGGFGVVYRAFDTNLERSVAIKMLPPKIAKASQGLVERFLREARSAAKLSHPNIVTIHQICPYRDTYYIVMELVDGGALHEFLAVQKRFTPQEATRVIRAAAEGLGHAHRRGIIHRDIKPGNIMMTNDGQVKVSDFGLARDVLQGRDIVGPGHSLGTPRYMAPEQALGDEPTSASDLYSLAATYYALLTGRAPFDGHSDRELMKKHVTEDVPDPRKIVADLPVSVFRFFERAMAKQPEDRYQTAEEFVEALDRLNFEQTEAGSSAAQALSAQIGQIVADERGGHVTKAIEKVAVRSQKQRTPLSTRSPVYEPAVRKAARPAWVLWAVIGGVAAVVIIVAVVVAMVLSKPKPPTESSPTPSATSTPAAVPSPGATQPISTSGRPGTVSTTTPPEKEPGRPPVKGSDKGKAEEPVDVRPPAVRFEEPSREALKIVQDWEKSHPETSHHDLINMYKEQVINVYAGTPAAKEAQQAIDRLIASDKGPDSGDSP